MQEVDRKIDIEILLFFMFFALFSFSFYVYRHPSFYIYTMNFDRKAILAVYMPDLIIFLSFLLPYLFSLLFLIFRNIIIGKSANDRYFFMLFFPLLAIFFKGMNLPEVYVDYAPITLIRNNFGFFAFIILGIILNLLFNRVRKKYG